MALTTAGRFNHGAHYLSDALIEHKNTVASLNFHEGNALARPQSLLKIRNPVSKF